jgi:hypothetical protein
MVDGRPGMADGRPGIVNPAIHMCGARLGSACWRRSIGRVERRSAAPWICGSRPTLQVSLVVKLSLFFPLGARIKRSRPASHRTRCRSGAGGDAPAAPVAEWDVGNATHRMGSSRRFIPLVRRRRGGGRWSRVVQIVLLLLRNVLLRILPLRILLLRIALLRIALLFRCLGALH